MPEYALSSSEFHLFRDLIYKLTGIVLSDAKRQMVQGRLQKRLRYHKMERFEEYCRLIAKEGENSEELTEFINCLTTNKTDFFREAHHFDFVAESIIPGFIQRASLGEAPRRIRVWHAGCSTGEEPYSLAITLAEALEGHGNWDIRQLASDIDTKVLAHAEQGVYEAEKLAPVPKALLRKHFLRGRDDKSDLFKVKPFLQERIAFRQINLLDKQWPIHSSVKFDMIFCRNVVIYFDKPTQKTLFARFQQYLRPGGHLFIGHSESLLGVSDAFQSLGGTIYRLPEPMEAIRKNAA